MPAISNLGSVTSGQIKMVKSGLKTFLDAGSKSSYPGAGSTWYDLSGNSNNGSVGSVVYSANNGGRFYFNDSGDCISLVSNSLDTNSNITVGFWVMLTSTSSIFTLLGAAPGGSNSYLQIRYNGASIQVNKSNAVNMGTFSNFTPTANVIENIVVTLDKSTNTWSLYANGAFKSSFVSNQTFATSLPGLGLNDYREGLYTNYLYGFNHYNRTLSAAEVLQNYNALKSRYQ